MAVDAAGNVYIADSGDNAIQEWNAATKKVSTVVTNGMDTICGVAADRSGDIYYISYYNDSSSIGTGISIGNGTGYEIEEWNAATQVSSTLANSETNSRSGLAVDGSGNLYFANAEANAIVEWSNSTQTTATLASVGLISPQAVAVDAAGNVYIADSDSPLDGGSGTSEIKEWNAATQTLSTLVSTGLSDPFGVAVDALGNVYIADGGPMVLKGGSSQNTIKEWNATTQTLSTLVSPVTTQSDEFSMAVDRSGNVYIADTQADQLKEWNAATQTVSTLVSSGLNYPTRVCGRCHGQRLHHRKRQRDHGMERRHADA